MVSRAVNALTLSQASSDERLTESLVGVPRASAAIGHVPAVGA